jgi:hypothetical protein
MQRHLEWVQKELRARILLACDYIAFENQAGAMREWEKAVPLRPNDDNATCVCGIPSKRRQGLDAAQEGMYRWLVEMELASPHPGLACRHGDPEFPQMVTEGQQKG